MTDEQRLQMITDQLILVRDNLFRGMSKSMQKLQARSINEVLELPNHTQSLPAQLTHECSRSHPHENMDAMCELRTEIARLTNENARLKAQPEHGWTPERIAGMARLKDAQDKRQEFPKRFDTHPTPSQRTWVGLTDEELPPLVGDNGKYMELQQVRRFYKYIEAKLKEKNT